MKKIAKMLLASSCLLTVVGTLPIANDFDIKNVYAEDTETISLNDVLKGETWVVYGSVNIDNPDEKYIKNFEDIAIDRGIKYFIDEYIKLGDSKFETSADKRIYLKKVSMLKENPDSENEFLQNDKVDSFDSEISADDSVIYEVNEFYPDLNLIDANSVSENGLTSRTVLYYSNDIIYTISLKDTDDEGKNELNFKKYLPIDSPELYKLRDAIAYGAEESSQTEEQAVEFNASDYTPINYTELMRDRTGKPGYKDTFYAEVMQYEEGAYSAFALLKKSGDIDQLYYAVFETLPDSRLVENDTVDVYGTLDGLYSYETVRGGTNTVPRIVVDKVLVEGIDY